MVCFLDDFALSIVLYDHFIQFAIAVQSNHFGLGDELDFARFFEVHDFLNAVQCAAKLTSSMNQCEFLRNIREID